MLSVAAHRGSTFTAGYFSLLDRYYPYLCAWIWWYFKPGVGGLVRRARRFARAEAQLSRWLVTPLLWTVLGCWQYISALRVTPPCAKGTDKLTHRSLQKNESSSAYCSRANLWRYTTTLWYGCMAHHPKTRVTSISRTNLQIRCIL